MAFDTLPMHEDDRARVDLHKEALAHQIVEILAGKVARNVDIGCDCGSGEGSQLVEVQRARDRVKMSEKLLLGIGSRHAASLPLRFTI